MSFPTTPTISVMKPSKVQGDTSTLRVDSRRADFITMKQEPKLMSQRQRVAGPWKGSARRAAAKQANSRWRVAGWAAACPAHQGNSPDGPVKLRPNFALTERKWGGESCNPDSPNFSRTIKSPRIRGPRLTFEPEKGSRAIEFYFLPPKRNLFTIAPYLPLLSHFHSPSGAATPKTMRH
ncbi:uncharacterized protein VTP21DRAFT_10888 [Calcarisporiella thermophila]|uniref:uncharacterized protein n=1 Tax=Calcarisporiella thermophila TaxID=911321 RepID=UPI0037447DD7